MNDFTPIASLVDIMESPADFGVPILARPQTAPELATALREHNGTHGVILLPDRHINDWTLEHRQPVGGAGAEPDQLLYIAGGPKTVLESPAPTRSVLAFKSRFANLAVSQMTANGKHSPAGADHPTTNNTSAVLFESARWTPEGRENGFNGAGFVAVAHVNGANHGTGLLGYGTGPYLLAKNDMNECARYGAHGLSGISFVRVFGNQPSIHDPWDARVPWEIFTPDGDPVYYVSWGNTGADNWQEVDSFAIGVDEPSDGNFQIEAANSEFAPGAVLVAGTRTRNNGGASINLFESPAGGAIVLDCITGPSSNHYWEPGGPEARQFAESKGLPYHPKRARWSGELMIQNPSDPGRTRRVWTFGNDFTAQTNDTDNGAEVTTFREIQTDGPVSVIELAANPLSNYPTGDTTTPPTPPVEPPTLEHPPVITEDITGFTIPYEDIYTLMFAADHARRAVMYYRHPGTNGEWVYSHEQALANGRGVRQFDWDVVTPGTDIYFDVFGPGGVTETSIAQISHGEPAPEPPTVGCSCNEHFTDIHTKLNLIHNELGALAGLIQQLATDNDDAVDLAGLAESLAESADPIGRLADAIEKITNPT